MIPSDLPQLYTSRWQNRDLADLDVVPVGISRGLPRFPVPYRFRVAWLLALSREAFALRDDNEFDKAYIAGLEEISLEKISATLGRISEQHNGKPLVLCCYESVGDPCHRRTFARWWQERTSQEVPELLPSRLPRRSDAAQQTLF